MNDTPSIPRSEWEVGYLYHAPCGVKGELEGEDHYYCPKCGAKFDWSCNPFEPEEEEG